MFFDPLLLRTISRRGELHIQLHLLYGWLKFSPPNTSPSTFQPQRDAVPSPRSPSPRRTGCCHPQLFQ
ncbi:hypothetical protein PtA15_14A263 [Puccinia triticina]|uniref:Uncharacterized protein n=1 Tax=Puccinia triticina TaxID=208348 RepID=A0ABY7D3C4_9BASI|nr:uncharacterized protein PtA15_14A263 [Puccinia triticina]WAQ91380.1 hypothetical protein PtA15_14A263 [Puccinia triticina]